MAARLQLPSPPCPACGPGAGATDGKGRRRAESASHLGGGPLGLQRFVRESLLGGPSALSSSSASHTGGGLLGALSGSTLRWRRESLRRHVTQVALTLGRSRLTCPP